MNHDVPCLTWVADTNARTHASMARRHASMHARRQAGTHTYLYFSNNMYRHWLKLSCLLHRSITNTMHLSSVRTGFIISYYIIHVIILFLAGGPRCVNIDMCAEEKCKNGATCSDNSEKEGVYECGCVPGYTGYNCQHNVDECASNPCQNGAACNNMVNWYRCTCRPGYTGEFQRVMTWSVGIIVPVFLATLVSFNV